MVAIEAEEMTIAGCGSRVYSKTVSTVKTNLPALAKECGISVGHTYHIAKGGSWKHLEGDK